MLPKNAHYLSGKRNFQELGPIVFILRRMIPKMRETMKRTLLILLAILLCVSLAAEEVVHTVKRGDTLYSISRLFGVSIEALSAYNGLTDPSKLAPGMILRIPSLYRVEKGDTLYAVARKFGTTVEALILANKLPSGHVLKAGETLIVPFPAAANPSTPPNPAAQAQVRDTAMETTPAGGPSRTPIQAASQVIWPHAGTREILTGKFEGVAILGNPGDPIVSISSGQVVLVQPFRGYGKLICVQSESNYIYAYAGNEQTLVRVGDTVYPGMEIGRLGVNPHVREARLFFTVSKDGKIIDPETAPRG